MERTQNPETVSEIYTQLLDSEPKFLTNYVPKNAIEQKKAFIEGSMRNPDHDYAKLDAIDFTKTTQDIDQLGRKLMFSPDLDPKHVKTYQEFVEGYKNKTHLMELAQAFNHATDPDQRATFKEEYMKLNIEIYSAPNEVTYRSLLHEKLSSINSKPLADNALRIKNELFNMVGFDESAEVPQRFKPADETIKWMHDVADNLYGGMLSHVPEQEMFTVHEVQSVFSDVLREEFGAAAEGWVVDIESSKSINVKATEKRIVIPEDRGEISLESLRGLVVHEIGVHVLHSINGSETDLDPLATGLNDYYDAEEGLGVIMEQAIKGKFSERGVDPYIIAGAAYYENKDFRDLFEMKWRLNVLSSVKDMAAVTDESIAKAKNTAYGAVMRIMRGTDELPWFKDLAYYNGSADMWRHLESIKGDDLKFMFVMMGKANPANIEHERILYETKTVG